MKIKSFKIISLLLAVILGVCCLSACSEKKAGTLEDSEVVAVIGDKKITRTEVGEELIEAQKEVISNYIYELVFEEFFSSVKVTDEELELQIQMMKAQIGEESWPMYLQFYGGGSEETFREQLKSSLAQEKYLAEKVKDITVSDEELKVEYDKNPNGFNFAVTDAIYIDTVENLDRAGKLVESGMTLEDISKTLEIDISKDAHVHYESEGMNWSVNLADTKVGDIVYTDAQSGNYVVAEIKQLHSSFEDAEVKKLVDEEVKYAKASADAEKAYIEFLKAKKVEILGENFALYEEPVEESALISDNTESSDDTEESEITE